MSRARFRGVRLFLLLWQGLIMVDALEIFSGNESVTIGLRLVNALCISYDVLQDPRWHNVLSRRGWVFLLSCLVRVKSGGLLWLAPVCATWNFLSKRFHRRTPVFPFGNSKEPKVLAGSIMASRCFALINFADANPFVGWWNILNLLFFTTIHDFRLELDSRLCSSALST